MAVRLIETLSLLLLLSVVALRPLVAESYDSDGGPFSVATGTVTDPSPLRTLAFDAVILIAAAGWLLARAIGPGRRYRWTGLEWGGALVLIAAVISCLFAGNKRLAINGAVDWVCYPILALALAQLLRYPWQRRLLVAVVVAGGAVQAFRCVEQTYWSFDETWAQYESTKAEFWAKQGIEIDSNRVALFEQRMKAAEASGTFSHSNVAASYLALCAFGALAALTVSHWRGASPADRLLIISRVALVGFLAVAIGLTKSLGAVIAGTAGLLLWLIVYLLRDRIVQHRRRAMWIGWSCVAVGGLAVVGHGMYHHSLPGWSLTFRWNYWTASAGMIADHPLTGIGRENFRRHYLQYKPITSPEEVSNPHNLLVQAAADWGVFGLVGVVMMLVGGSRMVCRAAVGREHTTGSPPDDELPTTAAARPALSDALADPHGERSLLVDNMPSSGTITAWGVALLAVVTLGRIPLLGNDNASFIYYATMVTGIIWSAAFACMTMGEPSNAGRAGLASNPTAFSTVLACGLFAFLLHDMINFALFVPASATPFFALIAVCVAERTPDSGEVRMSPPRLAWLRLAAIMLAIVCVSWFGLIPVGLANRHMGLAERAGAAAGSNSPQSQTADRCYLEAAAADPLDPTPLLRRAERLIAAASDPRLRAEATRAAIASAERASRRDPYGRLPRRMLMDLHRLLAATTGDRADYASAIESATTLLNLYPQSPGAIVALADRQAEAGRALRSGELLSEAVTNYQRALTLDDARLSWEEFHRFNARQCVEIESKIEAVTRLITQHIQEP